MHLETDTEINRTIYARTPCSKQHARAADGLGIDSLKITLSRGRDILIVLSGGKERVVFDDLFVSFLSANYFTHLIQCRSGRDGVIIDFAGAFDVSCSSAHQDHVGRELPAQKCEIRRPGAF